LETQGDLAEPNDRGSSEETSALGRNFNAEGGLTIPRNRSGSAAVGIKKWLPLFSSGNSC